MIRALTRTHRSTLAACCLGAVGALGAAASAQTVGPDVVYSEINGTYNFGQVNGVYGLALSSHTCNIGNQNLVWSGMGGSPTLAMNAYRLNDGMLVQIGQGWCKTACCAAAGSGCGFSCNGAGGGVLGSGCLDVYSASYNGAQSNLQPRSSVNAFTGVMTDAPGGGGDAIFKRLQVRAADLSAATYPNALYFVEGVYVGADEIHPANSMNNASYKRVTLGPNTTQTNLLVPVSGAANFGQYKPAIFAWRDHGLGPAMVDPSVNIREATVPGEGTFYVASKVAQVDDDHWRYQYAVYNLNSHRSGGSFSIPLPAGVVVTDVGFNDVDYHSGEPYSNEPWRASAGASAVEWISPETFVQNANSNALRWGTMYNFWFTANSAPGEGRATLGLFRTGSPASITVDADVPTVPPCVVDLNQDGAATISDIFFMLGRWFIGDVNMDWNQNSQLDVGDVFAYLGDWFVGSADPACQ